MGGERDPVVQHPGGALPLHIQSGPTSLRHGGRHSQMVRCFTAMSHSTRISLRNVLGNLKGDPVPVTARSDIGAPLNVAEIDERLTEAGICPQPDDVTDDVVRSNPDDWTFVAHTCSYVTKLVAGLGADGPKPGGGRNPWACSQAVRLHCAWRLGCVSEGDFRGAVGLLEARLGTLLEPGCVYCRGGRYEIPETGCPCRAERAVSPRDEHLAMREAALRYGIQHHDGGRILSVR
jgi:hypothetical protein